MRPRNLHEVSTSSDNLKDMHLSQKWWIHQIGCNNIIYTYIYNDIIYIYLYRLYIYIDYIYIYVYYILYIINTYKLLIYCSIGIIPWDFKEETADEASHFWDTATLFSDTHMSKTIPGPILLRRKQFFDQDGDSAPIRPS